jgi:hypothetical protein
MSFVDLMGNTEWDASRIRARCQALIAERYPADAEANLRRKLDGAALGLYALTAEEQAEVGQYATFLGEVQALGLQAEADWVLLEQTFTYEKAVARLAQPIPDTPSFIEVVQEDGSVAQIPNPILVQDESERVAAQAVIDSAVQSVIDLSVSRSVAVQSPVSEM